MPGKWRLTITQDFSSSHQLRNYGGKCENMHGPQLRRGSGGGGRQAR